LLIKIQILNLMIESNTYSKLLSNFITKEIPIEEIVFKEVFFEKVETKTRLKGQELLKLGLFDPNLFQKHDLFQMQLKTTISYIIF